MGKKMPIYVSIGFESHGPQKWDILLNRVHTFLTCMYWGKLLGKFSSSVEKNQKEKKRL